MAIDTAAKRASVLHVGSFFPGRVPQSKDRDSGDLDDANQRGFVLWHYAGIAAGAPVVVELVIGTRPIGRSTLDLSLSGIKRGIGR